MRTEEPVTTRLAVVRWLYLLSPLMLAWFVWTAVVTAPGFGLTGRPLVVGVATGAFVVAVFGRNATATVPVRGVHVAFVGALLASSVTLLAVQPDGPGGVAVLVAVLCAATLLPARVAVPLLIAAFVVLEMIASITGQGFGDLAVLAVVAVLFAMMYLAFRLAEAHRETKRLLAELTTSQAAQAEAAGLAERQRLAREMHDVLAHSLSGLLLQLEGARMLAASDPGDPRLPAAIDRAAHLARAGLDEARGAIGMLRDDDLPGPDRLAGLASRFAGDQAVPCDFEVSGEPRPLGSEARLALYRVAQEALTNVTRHATPSRVSLRLAYSPTETRLTVEDFGTPVVDRTDGGYGLTGMRERAELLGGTLTAGATGHGFRVELAVPA